MDFLDPVKRRRHARQLMIGYVLVAILILLIVRFFVIWASGETINPRTGKITDYGLLFVDSKPGGAQIYLNGQSQSTTAARLNLGAGSYDIKISRSGYYDWVNKFNIEGQSVTRITYPFLFPKDPKPVNLKAYPAMPAPMSVSRDRHWLLVAQPGQVSGFDLYDTSKPTQAPTNLSVASSLLTNLDRPSQSLTVVEWANDNNHLLLKHSYEGGSEIILFSRTDAAGNSNLNRQFSIAATDAHFNNGRAEQIYLYSQAEQSLSLATPLRSALNPIIQKVADWKVIDTDLVLYSTSDGVPSGQVSDRIWNNGKTYTLTDLPAADKQLIDAESYQSHWYYAVGNSAIGRLIIYKDPLDSLKNSTKAAPLLSIITTGETRLSFSENGRFIEAQSGQQFNLYDSETATRYKYSLSLSAAPALDWMDGHRLIGNIANQVFVMDFDAQNQHKLIPTASGSIGFDGPWNHMYSFAPPTADGTVNLQVTDLRAGPDLPKP